MYIPGGETCTFSSSFPCFPSPHTFCHHRLWACIDDIARGSDFSWFFRTVLAHRVCFPDGQRLANISPRTGELSRIRDMSMEQGGEMGCEKAQNVSAAIAVYLDMKQSCMLKCL